MKGNLTKKIVKIKKIQKVGENLMVLLPKTWMNELDWNRTTKLVLEFLPHRKMIILSELNLKDSVQTIPNMSLDVPSEPLTKASESSPVLNDEEISDFIPIAD